LDVATTIICAPALTAPLASWRIAALGALIEVTTMAVALSIGNAFGLPRGDAVLADITLERRSRLPPLDAEDGAMLIVVSDQKLTPLYRRKPVSRAARSEPVAPGSRLSPG
jgi:hypothetical protein